jgi:hypothetical protein
MLKRWSHFCCFAGNVTGHLEGLAHVAGNSSNLPNVYWERQGMPCETWSMSTCVLPQCRARLALLAQNSMATASKADSPPRRFCGGKNQQPRRQQRQHWASTLRILTNCSFEYGLNCIFVSPSREAMRFSSRSSKSMVLAMPITTCQGV